MVKTMMVPYPVKIHLPGCKCKHYKDKIRDNNYILVSPYIKSDFKKKYFVYTCPSTFYLDKHLFIDNCLCTYCDGIYNGGVVIITKNRMSLKIDDTVELSNVRFEKLSDVAYKPDNSHLINNFHKHFPSLSNYYTIVGNTNNDTENYTFPKGKISLCDKSVEECCYREFTEETGCHLKTSIVNKEYQDKMREHYKISYIPYDVIIDNFLLKIIVI